MTGWTSCEGCPDWPRCQRLGRCTPTQMETLIEPRDPRSKKKAEASLRRDVIALLEKRLGARRCFWTFPFGHRYGASGGWLTSSSTDAFKVSRCDACERPYSWSSFSLWDLLRFAEGRRGYYSRDEEPLFTTAELESFGQRSEAVGV